MKATEALVEAALKQLQASGLTVADLAGDEVDMAGAASARMTFAEFALKRTLHRLKASGVEVTDAAFAPRFRKLLRREFRDISHQRVETLSATLFAASAAGTYFILHSPAWAIGVGCTVSVTILLDSVLKRLERVEYGLMDIEQSVGQILGERGHSLDARD